MVNSLFPTLECALQTMYTTMIADTRKFRNGKTSEYRIVHTLPRFTDRESSVTLRQESATLYQMPVPPEIAVEDISGLKQLSRVHVSVSFIGNAIGVCRPGRVMK